MLSTASSGASTIYPVLSKKKNAIASGSALIPLHEGMITNQPPHQRCRLNVLVSVLVQRGVGWTEQRGLQEPSVEYSRGLLRILLHNESVN